ncbi:MAG: 50S ribosomal protein L25/general stress protein Ctc [Flavobacteriales bacterium]|nr:50S ribosomal protein L25/general stress protein Ctc [Flavobacteriales bacterium]|tara:strand:+ start:40456 stop:41094 length:639 start_codon:yes stop_codon:yes gene_type:complete
MKSVSINGIARVDLGKKFAKKLRKEDNVPCVIYGGKETPVHFYAHSNEFRKIVYTPNVYLIDIVIEKQNIKAIMGDIQFHPVTDKILHIDFIRIFDNKKFKVELPIVLEGNSIGVRNGGRLALNMRRLCIEGLSADMPENINIDISNVKIGQAIRVSDLNLDNLTIINNPNDVVMAVKTARAAIQEENEVDSPENSEEPKSEEPKSEENTSE